MVLATNVQIKNIGNLLNDTSRPLKERFRALFTLKNIGGALTIKYIANCFSDPSALLKHELAYCLGQMQDESANSILMAVLEDVEQEPIVRHEAAEALGAIGKLENVEFLAKFKNDPVVEVAETCQIAVERIKWLHSYGNNQKCSGNPFNSVDPAPPMDSQNIDELKTILLNERATLFERYRAMFSLRNMKSNKAVEILGLALKYGSALFRHEVAFVLGQLQNKHSVTFLKESLENEQENEMVRHECAEALGAIASEECTNILNKYINDKKTVVKESCEIALDMCEYENSPEFQYANVLTNPL